MGFWVGTPRAAVAGSLEVPEATLGQWNEIQPEPIHDFVIPPKFIQCHALSPTHPVFPGAPVPKELGLCPQHPRRSRAGLGPRLSRDEAGGKIPQLRRLYKSCALRHRGGDRDRDRDEIEMMEMERSGSTGNSTGSGTGSGTGQIRRFPVPVPADRAPSPPGTSPRPPRPTRRWRTRPPTT